MGVSRFLGIGLFSFSALAMVSCGNIGSAQDDSTKLQVARDSAREQSRYEKIQGTYKGQLTNPSTGLGQGKTLNGTLFVYVIPIQDGRNADGTPQIRPELHGRFQLDDYPTETDLADLVGDYSDSANLSFASAAAAASGSVPGGVSASSPMTLQGPLQNKQATLTVTRQGGIWGVFKGSQVTTEASAPAEGDVEEERERLRTLYHSIEGTYTAKIRAPKGNGFPLELSISQTDKAVVLSGIGDSDKVLLPALSAHFRRLDVPTGEGIGEYVMQVDYDALTNTVIMQSLTPDKAIPGSSQWSVRGTLTKNVLSAEVRGPTGYVGTITARATDIPPQGE